MIEKLSMPQQEALLELLVYMAKADGKVNQSEQQIVEHYAHLMRLDPRQLPAGRPLEEVLAVFDTPATRVIVLQYLLRLTHSDGNFADAERSAITDLAAMMGVPMTLLEKLEQWVLAGVKWLREGEHLLDEAEQVVRL